MRLIAPVLVLIAVLVVASAGVRAETASEQQSVLVATAPVKEGTLDETLSAYGLIQAAPGGAINIGMAYDGRVLRLAVAAGQRVRKDDPLFDFSPDPAVTLAYRQALSALTLARQEKTRTAQLVGQKLATQTQLDQADKAVGDARAAVEQWRQIGAPAGSQTVVAPFAGVIANLAIANGDHLQAHATILQLTENGHLEAVIAVEPESAARLAPDMAVQLAALARPGKPIAATVASVGGLLDPKTQAIDVIAPLPSAAAAALFAGEQVRAEIAVGQLSGWIVPRQAILVDERGPYLFQVAAGKAVRIAVSIVGEAGDRAAVGGALDPQRNLVISGNYELSDGMAVRDQAGPGR